MSSVLTTTKKRERESRWVIGMLRGLARRTFLVAIQRETVLMTIIPCDAVHFYMYVCWELENHRCTRIKK